MMVQELPGRCPHCNARVRIEYRPRRPEAEAPEPIALRCGAGYEGRSECDWRFKIPEPEMQPMAAHHYIYEEDSNGHLYGYCTRCHMPLKII